MSDEPDGDVKIFDKTAARRWEVWVSDELAGLLDYRAEDDRVAFVHAEIYPRFEGRGLATEMVKMALDAVIADGKQIVPRCPFVADFIDDNPDYAEHVAA